MTPEILRRIKKPNILDYFNIRRPNTAPSHFEYINIPIQYNLEKSISNWISDHLKGRFFVGKTIYYDDNRNQLTEILKIGFEDPKELSYFTLACPLLKYK